MPILTTSGGNEENDQYDVIFFPDVDSTSSPFCDDVIVTGVGVGPEVSTTDNDEMDDSDDVDQNAPKKRGPKKQPMTKARLAKVKVCLYITIGYFFKNCATVFYSNSITGEGQMLRICSFANLIHKNLSDVV